MSDSDALHPIIYVRGYAMSQDEIDETTADPFCGFNLGSTVYRATLEKDKPPKKFVFESPVVRLGSDFGYTDVFGLDIMDTDWEGDPDWNGGIPRQAIIVYRYYEQGLDAPWDRKDPNNRGICNRLEQTDPACSGSGVPEQGQ